MRVGLETELDSPAASAANKSLLPMALTTSVTNEESEGEGEVLRDVRGQAGERLRVVETDILGGGRVFSRGCDHRRALGRRRRVG